MQTTAVVVLCCACRQRPAEHKCSRCKTAFYCGEHCQREHWPTHKYSCGRRTWFVRAEADGLVGVDIGTITTPDVACMRDGIKWGAGRMKKLFVPDFTLDHHALVQALGQGSYGTVDRRMSAHGDVAVKLMEFTNDGALPVSAVCELMVRDIVHPNVIGVCTAGIVQDEERPGVPKSLAMIMDLASTDLTHYISSETKSRKSAGMPGGLDPEELPIIALQVLRGLAHCHSLMITVGDVKPENVLLRGVANEPIGTRHFQFKQAMIADFGLARTHCFGPRSDLTSGTYEYIAPEGYFGADCVGHLLDSWAAGCTIYYAATGKALVSIPVSTSVSSAWRGEERRRGAMLALAAMIGKPDHGVKDQWFPNWKKNIGGGPLEYTAQAASNAFAAKLKKELAHHSPDLVDLLQGLLASNPAKRMTCAEALNHDYFNSVYDYVEALLPVSGKKAPTAEDFVSYDPIVLYIDPKYAWNTMMKEMRWKAGAIGTLKSTYSTAVSAMMELWATDRDNDDIDVLFAGLNLLREYAVSVPRIDHFGPAALACYRLAASARGNDAYPSYGHPQVATIDIVETNAIELAVLKALDGSMLRYTAYDFFSRITDAHIPMWDYELIRTAGIMMLAACGDPAIVSATSPLDIAIFCAALGSSVATIPDGREITANRGLGALGEDAYRQAVRTAGFKDAVKKYAARLVTADAMLLSKTIPDRVFKKS